MYDRVHDPVELEKDQEGRIVPAGDRRLADGGVPLLRLAEFRLHLVHGGAGPRPRDREVCSTCTCPSTMTVSAPAPPAKAQPISSASSFAERIRNLHRAGLTIHPAGICQSPQAPAACRSVNPVKFRWPAAPIWLNDRDVSSAVAVRGPALRARPAPASSSSPSSPGRRSPACAWGSRRSSSFCRS